MARTRSDPRPPGGPIEPAGLGADAGLERARGLGETASPSPSPAGLLRLPFALALLAGIGVLLVLVFQIWALRAHSLSGDGSHHLVAGHQALRYGRNSVNLEHPPLAKLVMAISTAFGEPLSPEIRASQAHRAADELFARPELIPLTQAARAWVLALLVFPWFVGCYRLGLRFSRESGASASEARRTGWILVLLLGLSFGVLANLTILQTDVAVALGFVLTLLAVGRYADAPGAGRALVLGGALGLALSAKFSAVLLLPAVGLAWLWSMFGARGRERRHRGLEGLLLVAALLATLHLVFWLANRDYDPEIGRTVITEYCRGEGTVIVGDRLERWEGPLLTLERFDPYAAQWLVGFLGVHAQNTLGVYTSFALGEVTSQGRWWYFPVVFTLKTPLVLLLLLPLASWRRRGVSVPRRRSLFKLMIGLTALLYLAMAATSNYNLGVRHLLPILPFLYLPLAGILAPRLRPAVAVIALLAIEALALAPLWMGATSTWWLGESNPTRHALAAGNLEYRQNFLQLAREVRERELAPIRVVYPTLPRSVLAAYLPEGRLQSPEDPVTPGWYAVNVTVEQFVPAILKADPNVLYDGPNLRREAERWEPIWREILEGEDHGWIAGTFHLYRVIPTPAGSS